MTSNEINTTGSNPHMNGMQIPNSGTQTGSGPSGEVTKFLQEHPGTVEVSMEGVKHLGIQTFNPSELKSGLQGDILSTTRSQFTNRPLSMSEINDNTLVNVGSMQTTVKVAMTLGLISKDAQGNYSETNVKTSDLVNPQRPGGQPTQSLTQDFAPPETRQQLDSLKASYGKSSVDSLMVSVMGAVAAGEGKGNASRSIKDLASMMGMEPSKAVGVVEKAVNGIYQNAKDYARTAHGVDGDALFDWARDHCTPVVFSNILIRIYHGDRSVFPELIQRNRLNNRF